MWRLNSKKVALGGSNLFYGKGWTAKALFAGDISRLKTQNGLMRNVRLPTRFSLLPEDGGAEDGGPLTGSLTGKVQLHLFV